MLTSLTGCDTTNRSRECKCRNCASQPFSRIRFLSRRDSGSKPRVATKELPWVDRPSIFSPTATRLRPMPSQCAQFWPQRRWRWLHFGRLPQGRRCAPTLGFGPESLWDKSRLPKDLDVARRHSRERSSPEWMARRRSTRCSCSSPKPPPASRASPRRSNAKAGPPASSFRPATTSGRLAPEPTSIAVPGNAGVGRLHTRRG